MAPITSLSQLDPTKTYRYADYLNWKFEEFVELIKGKLMRPMAGLTGSIRCMLAIFLERFGSI
jgi:hypothetical protein